jgi:LacI family transcriptional regulator
MQDKKAQGRVTLRDIARRTGFTVNTVSRALNNKPDISRETCLKIQQAAREAGYIRNWMAGSLRTGRSNTIAVIVCDLSNPFFALMVADIETAAANFGYTVIVLCTHEIQQKEENAIRVAIGRQVDGILLCPCQGEGDSRGLLKASGIPYVLVSRRFGTEDQDALVCDEVRGGYLATEHLIKAGHRKLVFLSSFGRVSGIAERRQGFFKACADYGLAQEDCLAFEHVQAADTAAYLKTQHQKGFTGVFAYCDMEAWVVISSLQQLGLRVPRDLAFTGYDNIQGRLGFPFSLCSVDGSLRDICVRSVSQLDHKIQGESPDEQGIIFPVYLTCRGSCGHTA